MNDTTEAIIRVTEGNKVTELEAEPRTEAMIRTEDNKVTEHEPEKSTICTTQTSTLYSKQTKPQVMFSFTVFQ